MERDDISSGDGTKVERLKDKANLHVPTLF